LVNNKKKWHTVKEYVAAKKKSQEKYNKSPKGIASRKKAQEKFNKTDNRRNISNRFYHKNKNRLNEERRNSTARKESQNKYNISLKNKMCQKRYRKTHDPVIDTKEDMVRRACKKRDNYVCQWQGCNETEHLHAHHIFKRSDYPEFQYLLCNLITYCPFHHFWTHIQNGEIKDAIFVTAFMDVSF